MTDHLKHEDLIRFQSRLGPPHELFSMSQHLVDCPQCAQLALQEVGAERDGTVEFAWNTDPFMVAHLDPFRELIPFVDGGLSAEELSLVREHLACCDICAGDVVALREVRSERNVAETEWWTLPAAAPIAGSWFPVAKAYELLTDWSVSAAARSALVTACLLVLVGSATFKLYIDNDGFGGRAGLSVRTSNGIEQNSDTESSALQSKAETGPETPVAGPNLSELPESTRNDMDVALSHSGLHAIDALAQVALPDEAIRGADQFVGHSRFALISPVRTVVRESRPEFRWEQLAGADAYRVTVLNAELDEVASVDGLKETHWSAPRALSPGVYTWQVTAFQADEKFRSPAAPGPPVRFRVMSAVERAALSSAQHLVSGNLAQANVLLHFGLLVEAERTLRADATARDGSSGTVRLLRKLRQWREWPGRDAMLVAPNGKPNVIDGTTLDGVVGLPSRATR